MPHILTPSRTTEPSLTKEGIRKVVASDLFAFCNRILFAHLGEENHLVRHFHTPICDFLAHTPYRENMYLVSRGTFKTSILTVARCIQRILAPVGTPAWRHRPHGPNTRTLLVSATSNTAENMLGAIQKHLMNPVLVWAFPEVLGSDPQKLPEWTKAGLTVLRPNVTQLDSTIRAVGIGSELTGQHYDHGQFDDIVAKENSQSKDEREKVSDYMKKVRPVFDPGATRDYIGTHWHYDDHWARMKALRERGLMQFGLYEQIAWLAAEPNAPGAVDVPGYGWKLPTFPEHLSMAFLMQELAIMGSSDFAAQYLLDPISSDTAHFRREHVKIEAESPPHDDLWIVMSIDPAISTRKGADYAAMVVGGFDMHGDLWLLEMLQMRRDENALVREAYALFDRFPGIRVCGIEATGFQRVYQTLFEMEGRRRGHFKRVIPFMRDTEKTKNVRIGGLQAPIETGKLHALRSCHALDSFLDELSKFRVTTESAHDDLLDAVVDCFQLRNYGGRPLAPEPEDPELAAKLAFEAVIRQQVPGVDRMGLRMAWQFHQQSKEREQEQLAQRLGLDAEV